MKAVRIHSYGEAEVLTYEEVARPAPGEGEVLIHVHATTVNPFDCWVHRGYVDSYFHYTFPLIAGTDVAGVIEEVGSGVTEFSPGDLVYARTGVYKDGANAEYALAAVYEVATKPESLNFVQAAVPDVVLTAWRAFYELADLKEGQTVLIHAAAGGVGHIAVQLSKLRGAKVIGTASVNLGFLEELGVDQIIDYSKVRPRTTFIVAAVGTGLVNFLLSLFPLGLIMLITGTSFTKSLSLLPISIVLLVCFTLGIGLLLSSLVIFFPDVMEMYQITLTAWMYLTPIFYPAEIMLGASSSLILALNPLYYLIQIFRTPIYEGRAPDPTELMAGAVIAIPTLLIGWFIFSKKARRIAYV